MENVIFLDIDGVLNDSIVDFRKESVNVVKELIHKYGAKVVMITSWQMNGTERRRKDIQHELECLGIHGVDFIDPNFKGNLHFKGSLFPIEIDSRLLGIVDYLKSNEVSDYVILDDEYHNDYKLLCLNHYRTMTHRGLKYEDLSKITLKKVNLSNFECVNYAYRDLGEYERVTNNLVRVLKKYQVNRYRKQIN